MYTHVHTRLNDVHTRLYYGLYMPCTCHVHTCIYICRNEHTCMYMSMFFNNCIYHVSQLLYDSIVHTLYIHGSDMSVHVYTRWSGFQMGVRPSGMQDMLCVRQAGGAFSPFPPHLPSHPLPGRRLEHGQVQLNHGLPYLN